ncbi:malectin domain-containing carbohydrate-binding protein [Natronococcus pandeyae]|uniref:malectin domain-containing carbohydrate-binding protein n=1 Tax=Natronococcus pandeyae TaxID=2055836 RepID=UPI001CA31347|nr:GH32 C-terminal domain-containing protein [Natronococcus pandeyae]
MVRNHGSTNDSTRRSTSDYYGLKRRDFLKSGLLAALLGVSPSTMTPTAVASATETDGSSQPYRPNYHFAPNHGWMNDPNGTVYYDGAYHLFYQAGEDERRWDHAVSEDLLTWRELGTKLPVEERIEQWSGGGIVDSEDTAGFGEDAFVFHYTGHFQDEDRQDQRLAYSTDDGRTLTKYGENPVIESDDDAFRDPNVFWYEPDGRWRMVVARVDDARDRPKGVEIYESDDLIDWTYRSTYELDGDVSVETPDLYELPVEGTDETRWVLTISADWDRVEHHIGHFDGTEFTVDRIVQADYGWDFYAPMSWSGSPDGTHRWVAWMSEWEYAHDVPDNGWQGVQTIPRRTTLVGGGDGIEIRQRPVEAVEAIREERLASLESETVSENEDPLADEPVAGRTLEIDATIDPGNADAVGLRVRESDGQATVIEYDVDESELVFDRSESGEFFGGGDEYDVARATLEPRSDGTVRLHLLVDRCSVEVFANDGRLTMSHLVYPDWESTGVSSYAEGGTAEFVEFEAHELHAEQNWDHAGIVNAGGNVYTSGEGTTFRQDQYYQNGAAFEFDDAIGRTRWDEVYRTERVHEDLSYQLPLGEDVYDVVLHFAENHFDSTGERIFDVVVDDETVVNDLDIYDAVGGDAALRTPVSEVVVDDDSLPIACPASNDGGKLSAIEVTSSGHVNVGADEFYTTADEITYAPDRYYSGGGTYATDDSIDGTDDDELYRTERTAETLVYELPVGNGVYDVELHFAEIYFEEPGQRVFDVSVQGRTVRSDLDVYDEVGGNTALVERVSNVTVHDGILRVTAEASVDNAKISAIRVTTPGGIASWTFDEGDTEWTREAVSSVPNRVAHKGDRDPLWFDGIDDRSLLFDGYTTRAEWHALELDAPAREELAELTVDAWVAPRSTGAGTDNVDTIVELADRDAGRGFALGVDDHRRWAFEIGLGDDWRTIRVEEGALIDVYEWTQLTAVFDGHVGEVRLYKNGELATTETVSTDGSGPATIVPADGFLRLGRNADTDYVQETFATDAFNGAIARIDLHDEAFDDGAVLDAHEATVDELPPIGYTDLTVNPEQFDGDDYRPQFHLIPPTHWMNEPHAPLYYNGQYHLFYQHNPKGPYWNYIHWGHWVSEDLVYWEPVEDALRPEAGVDPGGCWSGDAFVDDDGVPRLLYTAGTDEDSAAQEVHEAIAADTDDPDLIDWDKRGPVMKQPDDPGLRDDDFRDPHVWLEGGEWFALVGSGLEDGDGGTALLYHSPDAEEWTYEGRFHELETPEQYAHLGEVWELPVLLPLGSDSDGTEKYFFCINPHEGDADVEVYYWIGEWDAESRTFTPDFEEPRLIDEGANHFTGPSGFVDPQGDWTDYDPESHRSILFTIAQDYRLPELRHDWGWAHNGGAPVELSLTDDELLAVEPIEELASLRQEKLLEMNDADPALVNDALENVEADTVEMRLVLESEGASQYGFVCRRTPDGEEQTLVFYDEELHDGEIRTDRTETSLDDDLMEWEAERSDLETTGPVPGFDHAVEPLELRVFVDKSLIECYLNGLKSVTTRAYPSREDANELRLYHDGDLTVRSIEIWEMDEVEFGPSQGAEIEDGGTYCIENVNSGRVLDVEEPDSGDGANVQQADRTDEGKQRWTAHEVDDGVYRFENAASGRVLDVEDAGVEDGDSLVQWEWWGGDNQRWTVARLDDGSYRVKNANSGKTAEIDEGSTADGADVVQWEWWEGDHQRWRFERDD